MFFDLQDAARIPHRAGLRPSDVRWPRSCLAGSALIDYWFRGYRLTSRTLIGRDPAAVDLVIRDDSVSSRHAELVLSEPGWLVRDLGSTNGVFVEGQRIDRERLLRPRDVIIFGEVGFVFVSSWR